MGSIPFPTLDFDPKPYEHSPTPPCSPLQDVYTNKPTFAEVLAKKYKQLPTITPPSLPPLSPPYLCGDSLAVRLVDDIYHDVIQDCRSKFIIGRLILAKGDKPWKLEDLKSLFSSVWRIHNGKCLYNLCFSCPLDMNKVWSFRTSKLSTSLFKLYQWAPDFHPDTHVSSTTIVWIHFMGLCQEY